LETKFYWFDEVSTSVQVSGYGDSGVKNRIVTGQVISVADLQSTQYPSVDTSVVGTIQGLAVKEPQLTPLYFILARWWVQVFGNSVTAIRSLSAVLSVLALACLYGLCRELFRSPVAPWIAIALFSISPFQLLYAQEARPSSLWCLTLLLSSVGLLRALRQQTLTSWGLYGVTLILGLYGHLFTLLVMAWHGVYVVIVERLRLTRSLLSYGVVSVISFLAFTPWIVWALIPNRQAMAGQSRAIPLPAMIKAWIRGVTLVFADFNLNDQSPRLYLGLFAVLMIAILGGIGYCLWKVFQTPQPTAGFITTAIIVPTMILVLSDVATGASRSATARYMIPVYLGIALAITAYFSQQLTNPSLRSWQQRAQQLLFLGLLSAGILSGILYSVSPSWWNKTDDMLISRYAQIINQGNTPLVVSNTYFVHAVALSYELAPQVKVLLAPPETVPQIPQGFSDIFFLGDMLTGLEGWKPTAIATDESWPTARIAPPLWKLMPAPTAPLSPRPVE
jgi:uncharacterized membrane protein